VSEVFVTDIRRSGANSYVVAAQWPRWHVFYGSQGSGFDSALISESLRQLTILLAHAMLEVPFGRTFLLPDMSVVRMPGCSRDRSGPTDVTIIVDVADVRRGAHGVSGLRVGATFWVDDECVATGSAGARIVSEDAYLRLRQRSMSRGSGRPLIPAVEARLVGHSSAWNVVLGPSSGPRRWPLRVDTTNPVLFDHPLDHVPGALLIEAARQTLRAATGQPDLDLDTFTAGFSRIVEINDDIDIVLTNLLYSSDGSLSGAVEVQANGTPLTRMQATATLNPDFPDDSVLRRAWTGAGPRGTPVSDPCPGEGSPEEESSTCRLSVP
jgi:hypothetical protein